MPVLAVPRSRVPNGIAKAAFSYAGAEVDYGEASAFTTYGVCGIKVWVFKGEVMAHDPMAQDKRLAGQQSARRRGQRLIERSWVDALAEAEQVPEGLGPYPWQCQGRNTAEFRAYGLKAVTPSRSPRARSRPRVAPSRVIFAVPVVSGSVSSRMCLYLETAEVRMGKGKGSPEYWVARVKPGRIMFEIDGVPWDLAKEALTLASAKLPLDTRIVRRLGDVD